ncbi:MAG: hypothetical protein ACE5JP_03945 [Candidatus Bipolaricaulia bacterium]
MITLDDVERLIHLSPFLGKKLISLAPIRESQDRTLIESLQRRALERIPEGDNRIEGSSFFLGSVDFMVRRDDESGELNYTVLETNGGSTRGISAMDPESAAEACAGYIEMLRFIDDDAPLIVIGMPTHDSLLYEKLYIASYLQRALVEGGRCDTAQIVSIDDFHPGKLGAGRATILVGTYRKIVPPIQIYDGRSFFQGHPVSAIIGDGVARRHYLMNMGETADVVLSNWVFPITDDKYLTYRAVEAAIDRLTPHRIYLMPFWQAHTAEELEAICHEQQSQVGDLVIKPFQGSGGAGVLPVLPDSHIPSVIEESVGEFRRKFGVWRNPFPYTACEKITSHHAHWRNSSRNYDIRVYVARSGDRLIPIGGLFRIALQPDTGTFTKQSIVVNLSGYTGIDVERGLGFNPRSLETVRLEEQDLVKIFAASVILLTYVANHYEEIIRETGRFQSHTM